MTVIEITEQMVKLNKNLEKIANSLEKLSKIVIDDNPDRQASILAQVME